MTNKMLEQFSTFQTSRLLYGTGDFYSAPDLDSLYRCFEQLLEELLGHSRFTLFFPSKLDGKLKVAYSTYSSPEATLSWMFDLSSPALKSMLESFQQGGLLLSNDIRALNHWPFPARYCALLKEEQTLLGLLIIHEDLNEDLCEPFPVLEILEPVVKHFTQALMRLKFQEEVERSLDETNAKLLAINEVGELLGQLDLEILLSKIMALSLQLTRAEVGNLMIFERGELRSKVEWGLSEEDVQGIRWKDGGRMLERVFEQRQPLLIEDIDSDARFVAEQRSRQVQSIVSIPLYTSNKAIGVLNVVNTRGRETFSPENLASLQTVAGLASTAIENAILHRESIEREVLREQLRIARQIWEFILPRNIPPFAGASISARSEPASLIGGDFYDFIPLSETRFGVAIADVSGKGIPAAMVMNMAKSILHIEAVRGGSPAKVLNVVNDLLVESTKMDSFVTLIYAVVDREARKVYMANAGHNPCFIYRHSERKCQEFTAQNMPLGILSGQDFAELSIDIRPGDCIVFYTDGITEAMNRKRQMFGSDRLEALLSSAGDLQSADEISQRIFQDVQEFTGDAAQHDDATVVIFKVLDI